MYSHLGGRGIGQLAVGSAHIPHKIWVLTLIKVDIKKIFKRTLKLSLKRFNFKYV